MTNQDTDKSKDSQEFQDKIGKLLWVKDAIQKPDLIFLTKLFNDEDEIDDNDVYVKRYTNGKVFIVKRGREESDPAISFDTIEEETFLEKFNTGLTEGTIKILYPSKETLVNMLTGGNRTLNEAEEAELSRAFEI